MSPPGLFRDGRTARDAVQLPCGHEVPLGGPAILIELSAAILAHQRMCPSDTYGAELRAAFDGPPPLGPIGPLL